MNSRSKSKAGKRPASPSANDAANDPKRARTQGEVNRAIDSTVTWVPDKFFVAGTPTAVQDSESIIQKESSAEVSRQSSIAADEVEVMADNTITLAPTQSDEATSRSVFGSLLDVNKSSLASDTNPSNATTTVESTKESLSFEEFEFPHGVSAELAKVFTEAACAADAASHVYPMSAVPRTIAWGKKNATLVKFLCIDEHVITVKIVGRVTSLYFYDRIGSPVERVNIGIRPLRQCDTLAAQKYLHTFSTNSRAPMEEEDFVFYASKYCTKTVRGHVRPQVYRFDKIWDGTRCVQTLGARTKKDGPESLALNDIVLLEVRLLRWKNNSGVAAAAWTSFTAGFQLEGITLLAEDADGSDAGASDVGGPAF
ncbi:hypothetical protein BDW22DRAFT_1430206 [Trametopsis cervina]|nr:hypothetical protein BDW22DRAFT_1430206 [Trametopsis cervina]